MRTIVSRQFTVDKSYVEIFGTSSESKPTSGIVTGSRFTEVDTGDIYLFNETASEWVKQPADSSLPTVTEADAGKVLTASTVTEKGAVIVPEQSKGIQKTYSAFTDTNASLFTENASVIVTITKQTETVERTASVKSGEISVADVVEGQTITIAKDGNDIKVKFSGGNALALERTISVNLANNSGVWVAQNPIGEPFIVTITPTALDYSGTMDKTVAEIDAAYKAGRKVVFRVYYSATEYDDVNISVAYTDTAYQYPSYNGYIVNNSLNALVYAFTAVTNDGTKATYATAVYALTPAT